MSVLPPQPPLTLGGKVRYMPLRSGATPQIPMNGAIGIRACRPVSVPVKAAPASVCTAGLKPGSGWPMRNAAMPGLTAR